MLKRLDLGPSLDDRYGGPCLEFHIWLQRQLPCRVTITHPLALSLLQARLLELGLPVCVRLMSAAVTTIDCHRQVEEFVRASITGKEDSSGSYERATNPFCGSDTSEAEKFAWNAAP